MLPATRHPSGHCLNNLRQAENRSERGSKGVRVQFSAAMRKQKYKHTVWQLKTVFNFLLLIY